MPPKGRLRQDRRDRPKDQMVREVLLEGISRDPIVSKPRLRSSAYFKGKTTLTQEGDIFVRARGRKQN